MLNEYTFANVSFRNIPADKRVGLRIGGVGLTIRQDTWNCLVKLAGDIGVIRPHVESQNDAVDDNDSDDETDIAEDEKMQTDEEETREENEQATENDESQVL